MSRRLSILGIAIGLAVAAVVLSVPVRGRNTGAAGPIFSDCDGPIRELVIQYVPAAAEVALPVYSQFLRELPADVAVHVVCPDRAAYDDFLRRVGRPACRLLPVMVGHRMTTWSRDRWLSLSAGERGRTVTLLTPAGEHGADVWPDRAGDARIAGDLAVAVASVAAGATGLFFDGGDFVADNRTVFVTPGVLARNFQNTVTDRDEFVARLESALRRKVVLLETSPDHHAGMFMMPAGNGVMLVGDPAAAKSLLTGTSPAEIDAMVPPGGADFSDATQASFDAVARQCESAGYRVVRMPLVPGRDGRTFVTFLNVIIDDRDGRRTVYMPTFAAAGALNTAAADIWRSLGYRVRPVDCTTAYVHFGSLRCLVNVLRRGQ